MNEQSAFERIVADSVTSVGVPAPTDDAVERTISRAGQTRQRPRWLALIKEPPMRVSSNVAVGSPTVRVAAVLVATLLLALLVAGAGVAGSRLLAADGSIVVDQSGDGTTRTITEAVAMAEDGDTVLVKPGTYDESVVLTKDITIRGDGERDTIIVELSEELGRTSAGWEVDLDPNLPTAFLFTDSDAMLEHLTVRGESSRILIRGGSPVLRDLRVDGLGRVCCEGTSFEPTGLIIADDSTATLEGNVIQTMDIVFILGANPTVTDNEISGGGIWMQGEGVDPIIAENSMDGIGDLAIWGGARPTVEANVITNSQDGIQVQDAGWQILDTGTDPIIRGNTISGANSVGVTVSPGASATIEDNVLLDNGVGISVQSDVLIEGNRLEGGGTGIHIGAGSPSLVANTVEGAKGDGILVGGGTSPSLSGNTSCDNGENLRIVDGATPDIDGTNEICPVAPAETSG